MATSITISAPLTVQVGKAFPISGVLKGYASPPKLMYSKDGVVPAPPKMTIQSGSPHTITVSWTPPPVMWSLVPSGSISRTSYRFWDGPINTPGNHSITVTDGTHAPVARFSVLPVKPTSGSLQNELQLTQASVTDAQTHLTQSDVPGAQSSLTETQGRLVQLSQDMIALFGAPRIRRRL